MPSIGDRIISYSKPALERMATEYLKRRPFIGSLPPVDALGGATTYNYFRLSGVFSIALSPGRR